MSLNNNDRNNIVRHAEVNGYSWNADKSKMTDGKGGSMKFSETGKSVSVNGSSYNNASNAKKSSNW